MSRQGAVRASGETAANEVAKEEAAKLDQPIEQAILPQERQTRMRTPGFSRMRLDWNEEDRPIITQVRQAVEGRILRNFADAYYVMNELYEAVRTPEVDSNGEKVVDQFGFTVWKRLPNGQFDEDFTRLTGRQKEHLLFLITTRLFEWHQRAADTWGEAMLAKSKWEERFSIAYDAPMAGTIEDRTAVAKVDAREEHYLAVFLTLYSRRAEAICRSMETLSQRLRDSLS